MLKFLRKKRIQEVVRIEDLQVGDIIQYDLVTRAKVRSIVSVRERQFKSEPEFEIEFDDATPGNHLHRRWTVTFFGNLQVFAWR